MGDPAHHGGGGNRIAWYALLAGLTVFFAANKIADPDTWWLLAGGKLVLQGEIPAVNTFSHTFPDYPYLFTQWLFAALIALAEQLGGLVGVQAVQIACAVLTFTVMAATARREAGRMHWQVFLPLFLLVLVAASVRISPRGEIATFLGLALVHYLWVRDPRALPLYFGVVGALWANLHSGVVFGLALLILMGISSLLERDVRRLGKAIIGAAAFFAGTLCNPNFFYPYQYVFGHRAMNRDFPLPINELMSPRPESYPAFFLFAAVAVYPLIHSMLKKRFLHVLVSLFFFAMALYALRFIPYFLILSFPGTYRSLSDSLEAASKRMPSLRPGIVLPLLLFALAAVFSLHQYRLNETLTHRSSGWGADFQWFPADASDYVEAHGFSGRMFNQFSNGGYLAWRFYPERRVFIDGRTDAYPRSHFQKTLHPRGEEQLRRLLDRYGVDFAIVGRVTFGVLDLGHYFDRLGWELVYIEGGHYIFVRPGSANARKTRGDVYRFFKPWNTRLALTSTAKSYPRKMLAELRRIDADSVLRSNDLHVLGMLAYYCQDPGLSERLFAAGLSMDAGNLRLRLDYAWLLKKLNRRDEARRHIDYVIRRAGEPALAEKARSALKEL